MSLRTANQIIRKPARKLPKNRSSHAITTDDPNTLNSNVPADTDGHGISTDACLLTLMTGALSGTITITVWAWFAVGGPGADYPGFWVKLGANSSQYSKDFDSKTIDGFAIPEKTPYYIQGSATIDDAWVDSPDLPSRDVAAGIVPRG